MNETFQEFCERMSKVEKLEEFNVGRACYGDSRAIFDFEGQYCFLESRGFRTLPKDMRGRQATPAQMFFIAMAKPISYWLHTRLFYGKDRAKMLAKYYSASRIEEDPYPREDDMWFSLVFKGENDWDKLMKLVWDIHTGEFKEKFGEEAKEYQSCIEYLEDK